MKITDILDRLYEIEHRSAGNQRWITSEDRRALQLAQEIIENAATEALFPPPVSRIEIAPIHEEDVQEHLRLLGLVEPERYFPEPKVASTPAEIWDGPTAKIEQSIAERVCTRRHNCFFDQGPCNGYPRP